VGSPTKIPSICFGYFCYHRIFWTKILFSAATLTHTPKHFLKSDQYEEKRPENICCGSTYDIHGLEKENKTNKKNEKWNHSMMWTFASPAFATFLHMNL